MSVVRRIREPIISNHDIHNAFDAITYLKGGAVLSMWESYLGEKRFQKAVSHHVKRFPFGVATSKDFLESLAAFSSGQFKKSADSFLNQTGFPVVDLSYECNKRGFKVSLNQSRYVPMGSKAISDATWEIPLCIGYEVKGSQKKHCFMMSNRKEEIEIKTKHCPQYVNPNYKGKGYYRYALNQDQWQKLINAPKKAVKGSHRMAMADSLLGELYAGKKDFAFVANALRSIVDKDDPYVVRSFMTLVREASNHWADLQHKDALNAFAKSALYPIYDALKHSAKISANEKLLRRDLAHFLANVVQDKKVRADLSDLGKNYFEDLILTGRPASTDEMMMSPALGVILQDHDEASLKKIIKRLDGHPDVVVRKRVLDALAMSRVGEQASMVRELVFDKALR
ncbi:MAG TPA: ERAP1-like C-terminal domain-containing protein, partial [Myxococcota bacterium]|nr:ERAP1-like C-terminal domain-containing protein [Myxococcota bacterium]